LISAMGFFLTFRRNIAGLLNQSKIAERELDGEDTR